jgi:hypothetical protein
VLSVGQHTLETTLSPTDAIHYSTATATTTLTVIPAVPVVTVVSSSNPAFLSNPVTFTANFSSIAGAPTGTVTFYDGATPLQSVSVVAGSATYITSALAFGSHSIKAVYSGDSSYLPATSGALSVNIEDFTLTQPSAGTATVYPGEQANYLLVITPVGGPALAGTVSFSVTGIAQEATVVFSPATVPVNSRSTTVMLQVKPISLAAARPQSGPFGKGSLPVALGLLLLPFAGRLRKAPSRWFRMAVFAVASAALAAGSTGCGFTYTPQNFSITITAASGSLSHATAVKLTVE